MNKFFILGNHQELSVAELTACFDFKKTKILGEVLLAELVMPEAKLAIKTLGGTIKIGRLIGEFPKAKIYEAMLKELLLGEKKSKFNFGISLYGKASLNTHKLGLELKRALKQEGISCRFVTSREKTLSSVVVEQNKLVNGGKELVLITGDNNLWLACTEAVQPFKELSARDYGRPGRDDFSGMLPPKLAQIMINLTRAKKDEVLFDPFCGSGTILTEGLLLGYKKLLGSDISAKALADSKKNMEWIAKRYNLNYELRLSLTDARVLSKDIAANSIGAIATETYLGPQRGRVDYKKVSADLKILYSQVLEEFAKVLKPKARAVMVLPIFLSNQKINPRIPSTLKKINSFVYGREGQRVFREILVLEK